MFVKYSLALLSALLITQPVFADDDMTSNNDEPCATIVKSCLDAGYTRDAASGKEFWDDCMKPLLFNKSVTGVTVDAKTVKACRTAKINKMKQELNALKQVKS